MSQQEEGSRRDVRAQERDLEHDRRHERWLALFGVLSLVPVAVIVFARVVLFS